MTIRFSEDVLKELTHIKRQDSVLIKKIEKQLIIFKDNPRHPSLRTHKLSGKFENLWSISITMSIRMAYIQQGKDEAYFIDIGKHEEVYK